MLSDSSPLLSAPGQGLLYVQAHPGSCQYLLHAPFPRPSPPPLPLSRLSTRQHHLLLQTVHPPSSRARRTSSGICCYLYVVGLLAVIPISLQWVFISSLFQ